MKFLKFAQTGRIAYFIWGILLTIPLMVFYPRNIPITLIYILSLIWLLVVEKIFFQYNLIFISYLAGITGIIFSLEVLFITLYYGAISNLDINFRAICFFFLALSFGEIIFYFLLNPNNPKRLRKIALNKENFLILYLIVYVIVELINNPTTWPAISLFSFAVILLITAQTFFDKNYPNFLSYGFSIIGGYSVFGAIIWVIVLEENRNYEYIFSVSLVALVRYLDMRIKRRDQTEKIRKPSL